MSTSIPEKVASALGLNSSSSSSEKVDAGSLAAREKQLQEVRRHNPMPAAKDGKLKCTPQSEVKTNADLPMLAAEYGGKRTVNMRTRASPMVTDPKDAVIRVTSASVCGTDIHLYETDVPGKPMLAGDVMGHECMGVVESVGPEVTKTKVGDRVVVSTVLSCGDCHYCQDGKTSYCESTNPSAVQEKMMGGRSSGLMGIGHPNGGFSGCQAERVRVPFADVNLLKIPDSVTDVKALLLSDILCTAWHGLELADLKEGQTVAIWGGGPVGQITAYLAKKIRKASRVLLVDPHAYRLAFAQQFGVEGIDLSKEKDVAGAIKSRLPEGGVDAAIDCAGFRFAQGWLHKAMRAVSLETDTPEICMQMFTAVKPCGRVALIGEYFGMANAFPVGHIMQKNLTVTGGPVFLHKYWGHLLSLVHSGEIDPTPFYSHHVNFSDLPSAYETFAKREEHVIKMFVQTEYGKQLQQGKLAGTITPIKERAGAMQQLSPPVPQDTGSGLMDLHGYELPADVQQRMTAQEWRNLRAVVEYMNISYNPAKASARNVSHLCASGNRFISPTTFPEVHTLEQYADAHGVMMQSLTDLHFESFDSLVVSGDRVALRYSATGTHNGVPHKGKVPATGKEAHWTAAAFFTCKDGKIVEFIKDWNKLPMWEQLGWPLDECYTEKK